MNGILESSNLKSTIQKSKTLKFYSTETNSTTRSLLILPDDQRY